MTEQNTFTCTGCAANNRGAWAIHWCAWMVDKRLCQKQIQRDAERTRQALTERARLEQRGVEDA